VQVCDPIGSGAQGHADRFRRGDRARSCARPSLQSRPAGAGIAPVLRLGHSAPVRGGRPPVSGIAHGKGLARASGRSSLVPAAPDRGSAMKSAGKRVDGRRVTELRPVTIKRGYLKNAEGSALIQMGGTTVLCAATVEERVPPFLRNTARVDAIRWLAKKAPIAGSPLRDFVAAVSVGIVNGAPCLDLCYAEDSKAQVDMNLVMTGTGRIVEIQGTAEGEAFSEREMASMM